MRPNPIPHPIRRYCALGSSKPKMGMDGHLQTDRQKRCNMAVQVSNKPTRTIAVRVQCNRNLATQSGYLQQESY